MLNVTLLYVGCTTTAVHDIAVHLLHLLYKRFFMDDFVPCSRPVVTSADTEVWRRTRDELFIGPASRSQLHLSLTLAKLHPDLTMPMFSGAAQHVTTLICCVSCMSVINSERKTRSFENLEKN